MLQRQLASACPRPRVAPGAVGHQSAALDVVAGEPGEGAFHERGDGRRVLIAKELAIGQAGVVIDDGVEVVVAERVVALTFVTTIAGDRMAWPAEPRVALDVHVQQISRARPLVAHERRLRRSWGARAAVTAQDRVNGRMRHPCLARDQPRPPACALARLTHQGLYLRRAATRRAVRPAAAIQCPGARLPLGL